MTLLIYTTLAFAIPALLICALLKLADQPQSDWSDSDETPWGDVVPVPPDLLGIPTHSVGDKR